MPRLLHDPLFYAGVLTILAPLVSQLLATRGPLSQFAIRLLSFALVTGILLFGGVVPYRPSLASDSEGHRIFIALLEVGWWAGAAWLSVSFLRWFVVLRNGNKSKLVQDLLAVLVYSITVFVIIANVFDLPIKGLLATSGVLAIVIGLALQSSLGDVFSGIVLDIEKPYCTGDWLIVDDIIQGQVIETNWRAIHILTGSQNVAIIPNSVIAKAKIVNCSSPPQIHGASIRIKLEPVMASSAACHLLEDVLLSSTIILRTPGPSVTVKDISADTMEFEMSYFVSDMSLLDKAQNDLFERTQRAVGAAGIPFARRLASFSTSHATLARESRSVDRLIRGISLFSSLSDDEIAHLATQSQCKNYAAGAIILEAGVIPQALCIIEAGVASFSLVKDGKQPEIARLSPGEWFGELGLLAGEAAAGRLTAVNRVVILEIPKEALASVLEGRPLFAEELSENLAARRSTLSSFSGGAAPQETHDDGAIQRIASKIRRLLSTHRH